MQHRQRTRRLFELGGMVQTARLVEFAGDGWEVLFGACLADTAKLQSEER
jgi:hypothetical protein